MFDFVEACIYGYTEDAYVLKLDILGHYASFKLRKKIVSGLDARFYDYFMLDADVKKVVLKQYY